eukprot:s201_g14.t1
MADDCLQDDAFKLEEPPTAAKRPRLEKVSDAGSVAAAWGAWKVLDGQPEAAGKLQPLQPAAPKEVDEPPDQVEEEEEEEMDLQGELELFEHLKQGSQGSQPSSHTPFDAPKSPSIPEMSLQSLSTAAEASIPPQLSPAQGGYADYADMEICSTASDEGLDFRISDSEAESAEPEPSGPRKAAAKAKATPKAKAKAKAAAPKAERKRKAPTLADTVALARGSTGNSVVTGDVVKILKPGQGKDKLQGTLATVSCELPPSSLQLTLPDGQQVLRKRSEVALVEKSIPVESAAEKMPRKSGLLRQLKTVEVERAEVLRGRQLERDTLSTGRQPKGRGKGRGKAATMQLGVNGPQLGSSFHQIGKVIDAEARVGSFQQLGVEPFGHDQIHMLRDDASQRAFGVPEEYSTGHAFHTYTLTSSDGSVQFQFKHNVCGRRTYGEGVADAVQFIARKAAEKSEKKVFNMIDILEAGEMK